MWIKEKKCKQLNYDESKWYLMVFLDISMSLISNTWLQEGILIADAARLKDSCCDLEGETMR